MPTFNHIKQDLRDYCKDRGVCADGYADLLRAENAADLWAVMREHINGMQSDLLCDYVAEHVQQWYAAYGDEARQKRICVNENVRGAMVIVASQPDFHATEDADYYVFGATTITARGGARVHCRMREARVTLMDYSRGDLENCEVVAAGRSTAVCRNCKRAECRKAASVRLMSGTLTDHGHRSITAYNGSTVYSITTKKITLVAGATIKIPEA